MVRISNFRLVDILKGNSRTSFVKIAKKLKVSETAIRKKIKTLEKNGIIKKYTLEIDPRKIGYDSWAFIGVDTKPEYYIKLIEFLKEKKEVKNLFSVSGDHMILAECWFEKSKYLTKFVKDLEKEEGTTKICPAVILEKII